MIPSDPFRTHSPGKVLQKGHACSSSLERNSNNKQSADQVRVLFSKNDTPQRKVIKKQFSTSKSISGQNSFCITSDQLSHPTFQQRMEHQPPLTIDTTISNKATDSTNNLVSCPSKNMLSLNRDGMSDALSSSKFNEKNEQDLINLQPINSYQMEAKTLFEIQNLQMLKSNLISDIRNSEATLCKISMQLGQDKPSLKSFDSNSQCNKIPIYQPQQKMQTLLQKYNTQPVNQSCQIQIETDTTNENQLQTQPSEQPNNQIQLNQSLPIQIQQNINQCQVQTQHSCNDDENCQIPCEISTSKNIEERQSFNQINKSNENKDQEQQKQQELQLKNLSNPVINDTNQQQQLYRKTDTYFVEKSQEIHEKIMNFSLRKPNPLDQQLTQFDKSTTSISLPQREQKSPQKCQINEFRKNSGQLTPQMDNNKNQLQNNVQTSLHKNQIKQVNITQDQDNGQPSQSDILIQGQVINCNNINIPHVEHEKLITFQDNNSSAFSNKFEFMERKLMQSQDKSSQQLSNFEFQSNNKSQQFYPVFTPDNDQKGCNVQVSTQKTQSPCNQQLNQVPKLDNLQFDQYCKKVKLNFSDFQNQQQNNYLNEYLLNQFNDQKVNASPLQNQNQNINDNNNNQDLHDEQINQLNLENIDYQEILKKQGESQEKSQYSISPQQQVINNVSYYNQNEDNNNNYNCNVMNGQQCEIEDVIASNQLKQIENQNTAYFDQHQLKTTNCINQNQQYNSQQQQSQNNNSFIIDNNSSINVSCNQVNVVGQSKQKQIPCDNNKSYNSEKGSANSSFQNLRAFIKQTKNVGEEHSSFQDRTNHLVSITDDLTTTNNEIAGKSTTDFQKQLQINNKIIDISQNVNNDINNNSLVDKDKKYLDSEDKIFNITYDKHSQLLQEKPSIINSHRCANCEDQIDQLHVEMKDIKIICSEQEDQISKLKKDNDLLRSQFGNLVFQYEKMTANFQAVIVEVKQCTKEIMMSKERENIMKKDIQEGILIRNNMNQAIKKLMNKNKELLHEKKEREILLKNFLLDKELDMHKKKSKDKVQLPTSQFDQIYPIEQLGQDKENTYFTLQKYGKDIQVVKQNLTQKIENSLKQNNNINQQKIAFCQINNQEEEN